MATLYELKEEYQVLLEMAGDPETDPEMLRDTMEAIQGELEDKADSYAVVMRDLQGDAERIGTELKRLRERKAAIENNVQRMKDALQEAMMETGRTKFKTALFSFGIQKNPASVVLETENINDIPDCYLKIRDPEIDKAAIKKDLQAGKELPGIAHLEQTEGLRIR